MHAPVSQLQFPDPVDFDIHPETGFVSLDSSNLPSYYQPWTALAKSLPDLLRTKQVGHQVDGLPVLSVSGLTSETHWRKAYVTLGFIVHAYIWEDQDRPRGTIRSCLGQPFVEVCERLGMNAVLSYAGLCLWNCVPRGYGRCLADGARVELGVGLSPEATQDFEKIESFAAFTRTRDEDAFYLVPVMVEVDGGKLIRLLLDAIQAGMRGETSTFVGALATCAMTIDRMTAMLTVLHQQCAPDIFYHNIRPFLGGGAGAEDRGLPQGIRFQCADREDVVVKYAGGSAGQSSLFQVLDCLFGIQHESKLLLDMRAYMPAKHRQFLEAIESLPTLRMVIAELGGDKEPSQLLARCVEKLQTWRTKHVAVVVRYIVQTAHRSRNETGLGGKQGAEQGTAGSLPVPFLKQYRDETKA